MADLTFEQLAKEQPSTILQDETIDGIRAIVMVGPASLCAYLGIPLDHPLAGKDYYDIDLRVHGGLTYANHGDGPRWPIEYFWYGWDYGHLGDRPFYDLRYKNLTSHYGDHEWTVPEVWAEVLEAVPQFKALMDQAVTP